MPNQKKFRKTATGLVVLAAFLCGALGSAWGQEEGRTKRGAEALAEAYKQRGIAKLKARELHKAQVAFEHAIKNKPKDGNLHYFLGVALNRLGKPKQAYRALNKALDLKADNEGVIFELAYAQLKRRRWSDAKENLEAYEKIDDERAQTKEFLGRAYLELGDFEKAEALFNEAMLLDVRLQATCRLYLMELEIRKGDYLQASAYLNQVLLESPDSPASDIVRNTLALSGVDRLSATQKTRTTLVTAVGRNSNVPQIPNVDPAIFEDVADDIGKSSDYFYAGVDINHDFYRSSKVVFSGGMSFDATWNESEFDDYNLKDGYAYLYYFRRLSDSLRLGTRGSIQYTWIGANDFDDSFRNRPAVRPALVWRPTDRVALEGSYEFSDFEFFIPVPPVSNRDGTSHAGTLISYYNFPNHDIRLRLGGAYVWNEAEGADYVFQRPSFFAGIHFPFFFEFNADLFFLYARENYTNPNSYEPDKKRRDDIDVLSLQLNRQVQRHTSLYLRGELIIDESNIEFYEYDQDRISAGLSIRL